MRINDRYVLNIDIDNVIYNWTTAVATWIKGEYGIEIPYGETRIPRGITHINPGDWPKWTKWEVWEDWDIPKGEFLRMWREGIEAGYIYREGDLIEGARETLWRLSDEEFHIRLVTDRLNMFDVHAQAVASTVAWLDDNLIPYRSLSFDSVKTMPAFAGLDDKPANVIDMQNAGIAGYLFAAPHNRTELFSSAILDPLNNTYTIEDHRVLDRFDWSTFYDAVTTSLQ